MSDVPHMKDLIGMVDGARDKLEECLEEDNFCEIDIATILPGVVRIAVDENVNICQYGRDCTADVIELYRYGDWIIKYEYHTEGDDTEVFSICHYFDNEYGSNDFDVERVLDEFFTVTLPSDIYISVLGKSNDMKFIMDYFRKVYPDDGGARLGEYIRDLYNNNE